MIEMRHAYRDSRTEDRKNLRPDILSKSQPLQDEEVILVSKLGFALVSRAKVVF